MMEKIAATIVVCAALIRLLGELRLLHGRGYSSKGYLKAIKRRKAVNITMLLLAPTFCMLCLLDPLCGLITAELYAMGVIIVALTDLRRMKTRPHIICAGKKRYCRAACILLLALSALWLTVGMAAVAVMFICVLLAANPWLPLWLACKLSD